MRTLLRSLFVGDKASDNEQLLLRNYQAFNGSGLGFDVPEYNTMWEFIKGFVRSHNHVPDVSTLRTHFKQAKEDSVIDQLERLIALPAMTKGDFLTTLEARAGDRRSRMWAETLKNASVIASTGMEVQNGEGFNAEKKFLQGPIHSARYIMEHSHDIVAPTIGGRLSGEVTKDGLAAKEEYERIESDPLAGIGQFAYLDQMDSALSGAKRQELWIHAAFTGGMKCLSGDTRIFDLKEGRLRTVREIHSSGDAPVVHALDEDSWKVVQAQASQVVANGVRPIFKVVSEMGRQIRVSGNHPFRTPTGWVNAEDLSEGSWVAVPGLLANSNLESPFSDDDVALIGYLIGDGHIKNDISFTSGNPAIMADFVGCLDRLGYREATAETKARFPAYRYMSERPGSQMVRVSKSTGDSPRYPWCSRLRRLLEDLGLWGCTSGDKHIPLMMWQMTDAQVWIFLSALWATDGSISVDVPGENRWPKPALYYTTKSWHLARDIQALLQRVGVPATISDIKVVYEGEHRVYWTVLVTTNEGKRRFLSSALVVGKGGAVAEALAVTPAGEGTDWVPPSLLAGLDDTVRAQTRTGGWHYAKWAKQKGKIQRDTLTRLATASGDPDIMKKAAGDIRWERLTEVTPDGVEMTYDLSVPGPANFVANGFITHNSTLMLNWCYNQAVIYKHSSLIFSLEMPYQQCRRILYAMHSSHPKFREVRMRLGLQTDEKQDVGIPYLHIRDGTLHEYHPNARGFYFNYVIPDFNGEDVTQHPYFNCDYGKIHIEVSDPDKQEFTINDLRSMAEIIYSKAPFSLIFVDHCGLMDPRRFRKSTTENLNEVIRDLKKLALGFNRGMGIAVVGLFQISREGYKSALKAKEKGGLAGYNLTHLSYANECLPSTCIIAGSSGLVRMDSLRVGGKVWSQTGWKEVQHIFDQGVKRLWKVDTSLGMTLEATASHRLRVLQHAALAWKEVQNLQVGDHVVSTRGTYPWPDHAPALPPMGSRAMEMDVDLAYLLGAWDGDGGIRPYVVAFTGNRKETTLRDRISSALQVVFGEVPFCYEHKSRPGSWDMEMPGDLKVWFETLAWTRGDEVPPVILQSPRPMVLAYLQGLFDTDGWINNQNVIGLKMKSESLLRQVQQMMTMLGYDTHLAMNNTTLKATQKTYEAWTLRLRGKASVERFADEIGFTEPWRTKRLIAYITNGSRVKDTRVYPVGTVFAGLAADYTTLKAQKTGEVSHGAIEYLLSYLAEKGIQDERADFLRYIITLQVMEVVSVEDTGKDEQVWDIEVGGDHEYQTGPLLSHNCERSADIVTTTWIDDDLKDRSRVQFDCLKSRDQKPFNPFIARVEWPVRRLYTCYDMPVSPEEAAKRGDEIDRADAALDDE